MQSVKQQLQAVISELPENCTMDDFRHRLYLRMNRHRLYLRMKMDRANLAIANGQVYTHEETVEIVKSWRKSSGQNRQ
jgi:hypothetical protein